jgi:hypothetical protein
MKKTSQFQSKFPENALLKLAKGNSFVGSMSPYHLETTRG